MTNLIAYIKSFFKNEKSFFEDTSVVFSGKVFIALIALILTPILTRLYNPEAYGEFALYNSIIQNLVILGTFALPVALNTAKKEILADLFRLTLLIISGVMILIVMSGFLVGVALSDYFVVPELLSNYWYLIPIGFLLAASSQTLSSLQLRLKEFRLTTKVSVTEAIVAKATNLVNGFLKMGGLGLILSDVFAKLIGLVLLIIKLPKQLIGRKHITLQKLKSTLRKVNEYPLFVMPSQWVSMLSTQLILWFIAYNFSANDLGKYVVALSLLNIPLHILSNSFQPVITQRFVTARDSRENLSMTKLLGMLGGISLIVFGTLFLIPPAWFVYFFGDQWQGVGVIIKILCGWNLVLFIDQSINNGFVVFGKQRQKLYLNLLDLGLQIGVLAIAATQSMELIHFISFFVLAKVMASGLRIGYLGVSAIKY